MLRILIALILIALVLSISAYRWRHHKPQWAIASAILAVALWLVIAGGFWGWLGGE